MTIGNIAFKNTFEEHISLKYVPKPRLMKSKNLLFCRPLVE